MEKKKKSPGKRKSRETKEKREGKEEKEIRAIFDSEKVLEERIKGLNQELRKTNFKTFSEREPEQLNLPPPLEKNSVPQKMQKPPIKLERSIASSSHFINKEENSISYSPISGENKKEDKYNTISKDYSILQKESMKQNANFAVQPGFGEFSKENILEEFHKSIMNPLAEESLRTSGKKDEEYFVKPAFSEKERKPHNPFEKKEIKYEKI